MRQNTSLVGFRGSRSLQPRPLRSRVVVQSNETGSDKPPAAPATGNERTNETSTPSSSSSATSTKTNDAFLDFLAQPVNLPGGYKTSRRDALKFLSLGAAFGSSYVFLSRAKANPDFRRLYRSLHLLEITQLMGLAYLVTRFDYLRRAMSFASPKAVLNALLPSPAPPVAVEEGRVAAFKRFIADLEERGGGEVLSTDFPAGADWLNVPAPLSLKKELRGKVLILDFWTLCCINCLHVLPELRYLERKYEGNPVTVVGVHSAKFDSEKDTEAVRNAVIKNEITHPVVNDKAMTLWKNLGVSSWPTLVVVSPRGRVIARVAGEGNKENLDDLIAAALLYYGEKGMLDESPIPQALERDKDARLTASPFRFPGKVAADPNNGRIFVSDTSNHRIVVLDDKGKFVTQVGGNGSGLRDGNLDDCAFNRPQGLCYDATTDTLFVADTENHALRAVDLMNGVVTTLAGNGQKGGDYKGGRKGASQVLNSPWDVILDPTDRTGSLLFAEAGTHQIWKLNRKTGIASVFSGSGYERNQNGTSPLSTAWAQPSGLAASADGKEVYVADSESSAIRALNMETGGSRLLAGGDPLFSDNLFRFGDRDGFGSDALLQHPLGVLTLAAHPGKVFIADSYNHRIKVLDTATNEVTTLAGSGKPGFNDGKGTSAKFSEPGGLSAGPTADTLLVADSNNNLLRVVNVKTGEVTTLQVQGVPSPRIDPSISVADDLLTPPVPAGALQIVAPSPVSASSGTINLSIALPDTFHFTPGTNPVYEVKAVGSTDASWLRIKNPTGPLREASPSASVQFERVGVSVPADASLLVRITARVYYCRNNDVCLQELIVADVPFTRTATETGSVTVDLAAAVSGPSA